MGKVELALATPEHMWELADSANEADRVEMLAMGMNPGPGLRQTLRNSLEAYTAWADGKLAACFGVARSGELSENYLPWLIGTDVIYQHPRTFLEFSNLFVPAWRADYPRLTNHIDARHTKAVKWMRWLGAEMEYLPEFGPYRRPFWRFVLEGT